MIKVNHENSFIQVLYYKKSHLKSNIILKFAYLFILIGVCLSCVSRTEVNEVSKENELTNIAFKKDLHDFGEIPIGKNTSTLFVFSNSGINPLLIKDVTSSCGCTVPKWSKAIIKPNEKGEIKIVYDAKYPGRFNKTIMVFYNGKNSPQKLTIEGEVYYDEEKKHSNSK